MSEWQLQDATAHFAELLRRAAEEGPQTVTVQGRRQAVVLSPTDYDRLVTPGRDFVEFLLSGPEWPRDVLDAIDDRPRDLPRDTEL